MVTRCVCFNRTFKELQKIAKKNGARSVAELQRYVRFGKNCQRCHPYVRLMLKTGETVFPILPESAKESD